MMRESCERRCSVTVMRDAQGDEVPRPPTGLLLVTNASEPRPQSPVVFEIQNTESDQRGDDEKCCQHPKVDDEIAAPTPLHIASAFLDDPRPFWQGVMTVGMCCGLA